MMSRFVSVIALLIGGVACSSDDDDDRKKRRDSDDDDRSERRDDDAEENGGIENETSPLPDTDEGRAIQEWAEEGSRPWARTRTRSKTHMFLL